MRRALTSIAALTLLASFAFAASPSDKDKLAVIRKSPEFQIDMPNGKPILLSSFKGKVVCLEFLFTTCPHCQHASQTYTKLYKELGPQGLQPIGIAVNEMAGMLVNDFIRDFKVGYPVGFSTMPVALHYLDIDPAKRWVVPQVVLIDRKGMIRFQTPFNGDEKVQDENFMRSMLTTLLAEPSVGNAPPAKKAPAAVKTAVKKAEVSGTK